QSEFIFAIWFVFFMIFIVLALLFQSLLKPLIIIITIPFGFISVIGAFYLHGMEVYGFFAVIGCLGLAGVVVNDSIVMLSKLINEFETGTRSCPRLKKIADVAKTRLRAVTLTTLTTVAGLFPTAYGVAGYDSMLAEMMLALGWGLLGGTFITLILVPNIYAVTLIIRYKYFPQSLKQGNKNVQAL
ncbi:MAG TPA: efflux RND transporter permease subunit, partial [Spirochaetota bacterium]|nr:efflux RND transporter permease subunit [Spirochaetota bacterium]